MTRGEDNRLGAGPDHDRWARASPRLLTPLTSILAAGFALPLLLIPLPIRTLIIVHEAWRHSADPND